MVNINGGGAVLMPKDSESIFVHKVETQLWKLYDEMAGPSAIYVKDNPYEREIRTCLECFYWEKNRHQWT